MSAVLQGKHDLNVRIRTTSCDHPQRTSVVKGVASESRGGFSGKVSFVIGSGGGVSDSQDQLTRAAMNNELTLASRGGGLCCQVTAKAAAPDIWNTSEVFPVDMGRSPT
ncbi:unnamed protein product [Arctogadus glacialis]